MSLRVSVIVRSYNRVGALCELVEVLLAQEYDSYEIVVVEQSTNYNEKDWKQLQKLSTDNRVNLLRYDEPLGGPKARNEGVRNAKGEILIFVDDDDLPVSKHWIRKHELAYEDPKLVGLTARHVTTPNEDCPYVFWMRWFIRKTSMSYSWLKTPYTFARFDEDIERVEWLHGTNSSIRKEWALKAGLWDTNVKNQDEHSFAFKLKPLLSNGFYLSFKKEPTLIRRLDIEGGMGKRNFSVAREFQNHFKYLTKVVYRYNPFQIIFFPLHLGWIFLKCLKYLIK